MIGGRLGVAVAALLLTVTCEAGSPVRHAITPSAVPQGTTPTPVASNATRTPATRSETRVARSLVIGHSVRGARIRATEIGDPNSRHTVLVVGCIHGNESAGVAVVRRLLAATPPRGVDLWLVATVNPDGRRAGTRQNAHGVDLNW